VRKRVTLSRLLIKKTLQIDLTASLCGGEQLL